MESDHTILTSALGTSSLTEPDTSQSSTPANSRAAHEATGVGPDSDAVMKDANTVAQHVLSDGSPPNQAESGVAGSSGANDSGVTGPSREHSQYEEEVAQLGFAVQFMVQGLRNGAGPTLMPLLVRLLPHLLKTQVS